MADGCVVSIDQGTTGTTVLVLGPGAEVLGRATVEVPQHYPAAGQVEHDANEIWDTVCKAIAQALANAGKKVGRLGAVGITNQRETTLVWDRRTGEPIHRAIVWQDRRTAPECAALIAQGLQPRVSEKTGLRFDPYFSGTKIAWILDHVEGARARAERGELCFGTMDSWVIWKLTQGESHITDVTNASRTLLMDLATLQWDDELLATLRVPRAMLPRIVPSAGVVAKTRGVGVLPDELPIAGIAGDQQAALFGQACFDRGDVKCTYGTGAFALMNIGDKPVPSKHRLLTTVAWQIPNETAYALEGSSFIAGAAVQWLRDGLGVIQSASEIEPLARSVQDSGELVFVPALTGLGAPHWSPDARGLITGIGRDTTRAHLARATLEGIALSITDLVEAMRSDAGLEVASMRVDGGAAANELLMELQAMLLQARVVRPKSLETTALGAGLLAAIGAGMLTSRAAVRECISTDREILPPKDPALAAKLRAKWKDALARTLLSKQV